MSDKYELIPDGRVFRIKALKSFGKVRAGDLGGLVSNEYCLSQEGNCWIGKDSVVFNANGKMNAVAGNAQIVNSEVRGYSFIGGNSEVYDSKLENCHVTDSIIKKLKTGRGSSQYNAGNIKNSTIENCEFSDGPYVADSVVVDSGIIDGNIVNSKLKRVHSNDADFENSKFEGGGIYAGDYKNCEVSISIGSLEYAHFENVKAKCKKLNVDYSTVKDTTINAPEVEITKTDVNKMNIKDSVVIDEDFNKINESQIHQMENKVKRLTEAAADYLRSVENLTERDLRLIEDRAILTQSGMQLETNPRILDFKNSADHLMNAMSAHINNYNGVLNGEPVGLVSKQDFVADWTTFNEIIGFGQGYEWLRLFPEVADDNNAFHGKYTPLEDNDIETLYKGLVQRDGYSMMFAQDILTKALG